MKSIEQTFYAGAGNRYLELYFPPGIFLGSKLCASVDALADFLERPREELLSHDVLVLAVTKDSSIQLPLFVYEWLRDRAGEEPIGGLVKE